MPAVIAPNRAAIKDPEMRTVYADVLENLIRKDKRIVALDADLMRAIGTFKLWDQYPDNIIECGIAEANMIGVAAGLSNEGLIPFAHSFGAFASRRDFDQIFMSCSYANLNVKIIGSDPGVVAQLNGGTHTANEDIAMMRAVPNMTVLDVTDVVMARQILPQIAATNGVFYIRYPRCAVPRVYEEGSSFSVGKAVRLRDGKDLTIIAAGIEVSEALDAADILQSEGIEARVVDMFTIKPLDESEVIAAAHETGAIVVAENHNCHGGLYSAVAECLAKTCPVKMEQVANKDRFGDVGSLKYLMEEYGLTAQDIVRKARAVLGR